MPRPKQCRRVCLSPDCTYFKPAGVATSTLEEVVIAVDELEAMRLVDIEELYYEQAAEQMGVSRRTFGRIIDSARKKTAQALIRGIALRIEGGMIEMAKQRTFQCGDCGHEWQLPFGTGRPSECPQCQSTNFHRMEGEQAPAVKLRGQGGSGRQVAVSDDVKAETTGKSAGGQRQRRRRRRRGASV